MLPFIAPATAVPSRPRRTANLRLRLLIACCAVLGCASADPETATTRTVDDADDGLRAAPAWIDPEPLFGDEDDLAPGDDDDHPSGDNDDDVTDNDDDVTDNDDDVRDDGDDDDLLDTDGPVLPSAPCPDPSLPWPATPFTDVSLCAGVTVFSGAEPAVDATGQAWGDVDGDGDQDLFLTDPVGGNTLLLNDGDGTFSPAPNAAVLQRLGAFNSGATFVDYDGDGDLDLYVLAKGPNALFRNDGGTGWTDVTADSGTGDPGWGMSAAWADYDQDGDLDLYVTSYECVGCPWLDPADLYLDRLFENQGDGTFDDVTPYLGLDLVRGDGYAAVWLDFDDDGDLDLYVVNDRGSTAPWSPGERTNRNMLFRNDGAGCTGWCFAEVGQEVGADLRIDGMGVAVGDYDGDLDLDIAASAGGDPRLLQNVGGIFVEVTLAAGLDTDPGIDGWGLVFLDYDNDGDLDLYLADGANNIAPNRLYRNNGDATFTELGEASGAWTSGRSCGVAMADYDGDGGLDLVVGNREADYQLFRNLGAAATGGWIRLRIEDGVGARAFVTSSDGVVMMQEGKIGSSLGASHDPALHFGLAGGTTASVEVTWPGGDSTTLDDPGTNLEIFVPRP
jgi:hypothetical protein